MSFIFSSRTKTCYSRSMINHSLFPFEMEISLSSDTKGVHWIKSSNGIFVCRLRTKSRAKWNRCLHGNDEKSFIYNLAREKDGDSQIERSYVSMSLSLGAEELPSLGEWAWWSRDEKVKAAGQAMKWIQTFNKFSVALAIVLVKLNFFLVVSRAMGSAFDGFAVPAFKWVPLASGMKHNKVWHLSQLTEFWVESHCIHRHC